MTTEEINKAGWEYANKSIDETTEIPKNIELIKASAVVDFIEGAKFVNKHWQEKTRWRSLLTAPPELPSNPSEEKQVLIKHAKGGYDVKFLVKQSSIDYWLKEGFVFWKEIE